ncbi:MAG TPA: hypothetical protein IAB23_03290 [Candidatus Scybalocola faecavium]|nr:hypothetical protein [Candidatus Scybalocola faecavium]
MREILDRIRAAEEGAKDQVEAAKRQKDDALALARKNAGEQKEKAKHQAKLTLQEEQQKAEKKAEEDARQIFLKGEAEREQLKAVAAQRQTEAIRQIFIYLLGQDLENPGA